MRIAGVILVWLILMGGISSYMTYQSSGRKAAGLTTEEVVEKTACTFEITSTFTAEKDPFALDATDDSANDAFILRLGNRVVLRTTERIRAGIPFRTEIIEDVNKGRNELYFEASPPVADYIQHNALRVKVYKGDRTIAEQTFWGEPGAKIAGTIGFELNDAEDEDQHAH